MSRGRGPDKGARIQGRYSIDGDAVAAAAAVLRTLARTGAPSKAIRELAEMVIPARDAPPRPAAMPPARNFRRPPASPPRKVEDAENAQNPKNADSSFDTKGIPVLPAFSTVDWDGKTRILKVWCRHCRKWHVHSGGQAPGGGDGHREAHCLDAGSPFRKTGYILREIAELSE